MGENVYHASILASIHLSEDVSAGYTNVLKIDLKCPEKYIKAYIFFLLSNGLSSNLEMLLILAYI
jgi:hypothetical protein